MNLDIIGRLAKSRIGPAALHLAAAAAIFPAGTRSGEFLAFATGAAG